MVTLKNPTNKCIRCCSRINGRWFDGIFPDEELVCDEPHKISALLKHGCEVVKKKVKPKKVVENVEKPKRKRKVKKKEVE